MICLLRRAGIRLAMLLLAGMAQLSAQQVSIASIVPDAGPPAGGTSITITGSDFASGDVTVMIGSSSATSIVVISPTTITCTTPAGTVGPPQTVTVTNTVDTSNASSTFTYTNNPAPVVGTVSPIGGPLAGSTAITISGGSFVTGATVTIGGTAATAVTVVNSSSITCTTPAGPAGPAPVVVTNPDTQLSNSNITFSYEPAPAVTAVLPTSGPQTIGSSITISGSGFVTNATVTIGGVAATAVNVANSGSITCTTPTTAAAGADAVVVTNPDTQQSNNTITYTFIPPPAVASVAPIGGPTAGGTTITISGSAFQTGATLTIGGVPVTPLTVAAGTITCTSPGGASGSSAAVVVTNPDNQVSNNNITFGYEPAPAVTAVLPTSGPQTIGTSITISGSGFLTGATVTIGGVPATSVTVTNSGSLSCTTPTTAAAGPDAVVVTNADTQQSNNTITYTFNPPPAVSAVTPGLGPVAGGTGITISGSNFLTGATVTINGNAATSVAVTATSISCNTPAGVAGPATVVVTNPDTQSANGSFIYQGNGPTISAVNPSLAPASGGTALTITGSGFLGSTVTIGGAPATSVVVSATSISCVSPAGTPGPANVVVTNSDLTSAQTGPGSTAFIFQGPLPTITLFTPDWGPNGSAVTISGTNFDAGAHVLFDRTPATSVVVVNAETVTCTIPSGVYGWQTVTVTNPDFTSAISVNGFNVIGDSVVKPHQCGGSHGFSILLLAPFIAWRLLLNAASRRRRAAGTPDGPGGRCPPPSSR